MLQIAICDDEQFYREKIEKLLRKFFRGHDLQYEICVFSSGKEFLEQCENNVRFDIVFLDINMEEMDGIRTAMHIRSFHSNTFIVLSLIHI